MIRLIPLAGTVSAATVATAMFVFGFIPLATVGLIIASISLGVAAYLSFVVEPTEFTRAGVLLFLTYAAGMGALTAPAVFGYEYIRMPGRVLAGLLLGLVVAVMWEFYVTAANHQTGFFRI